MKKYIAIITTCNCKDNLKEITQRILLDKLSPCIQEIQSINSSYLWNDEIKSDKEYLLLIKTLNENKDKICNIITSIHKYDIPEVISLDFDIINENYNSWFNKSLLK